MTIALCVAVAVLGVVCAWLVCAWLVWAVICNTDTLKFHMQAHAARDAISEGRPYVDPFAKRGAKEGAQ